jgi:hypothetical protein
LFLLWKKFALESPHLVSTEAIFTRDACESLNLKLLFTSSASLVWAS